MYKKVSLLMQAYPSLARAMRDIDVGVQPAIQAPRDGAPAASPSIGMPIQPSIDMPNTLLATVQPTHSPGRQVQQTTDTGVSAPLDTLDDHRHAYNPNGFWSYTTVEQLRNPPDHLTMLVAHRGLFAGEQKVPENSLKSLELAAKAGIEAVELDLRLTKDGVPVLSHDQTWGRQAVVPGQPPFDTNLDAPDSKSNPRVDSLTLEETKQLKLRYPNLVDVSGESPPTLEETLKYIREKKISMALFLDIKDKEAAKKVWEVIATEKDQHGVPFCHSSVLKLEVTNYPTPADFKEAFNTKIVDSQLGQVPGMIKEDWEYANFMPIFQSKFLQHKLFNPSQSVVTAEQELGKIYDAYADRTEAPFFVMAELVIKAPNGPLRALAAAHRDPNTGGLIPFATFHPVDMIEDAPPFGPEVPGGRYFESGTGKCCYYLTKHFSRGFAVDLKRHGDEFRVTIDGKEYPVDERESGVYTVHFGGEDHPLALHEDRNIARVLHDELDLRPFLSTQVEGLKSSLITTDVVDTAENYLLQRGLRYIEPLKEKQSRPRPEHQPVSRTKKTAGPSVAQTAAAPMPGQRPPQPPGPTFTEALPATPVRSADLPLPAQSPAVQRSGHQPPQSSSMTTTETPEPKTAKKIRR